MELVVNNIIATTDGHLDLLVVTHEHWDHLSGFVQAKNLFAKLKIDKIWFAWTEDPNDALAKKLRSERHAFRLALTSACARMRLGGAEESRVDSLMEFFGAAGQGTTGEALTIVKGLSSRCPLLPAGRCAGGIGGRGCASVRSRDRRTTKP